MTAIKFVLQALELNPMLNRSLLALLASTLVLGACSLAPVYETPQVPLAPAYQGSGPWQPAAPALSLPRDGWWKIYQDAQLDTLQQRLLANNPDLSAALAHYQQAQAFVSATQADLYPKLGMMANPLRERQSDNKPLRGEPGPADYNSVTLGGQLTYEVDLWGKVRDDVAASRDEAEASRADLAEVQVNLQAQLADNYLQLRGYDQQDALLAQTIIAFAQALRLTQNLHDGGVVSELDVARARTQLSSARSLLQQTQAQRALTEHAIAVLVGSSASQFKLAPKTDPFVLPPIPLGVPSALLQRRPDIAAAERRTAAANAKIGVARSAYFPSLTLSAQCGYQSDAYQNLFSAPNLFWAGGPMLASYLFDGGRRSANVTSAKAAENEAGAHYRAVVLTAFREVEDSLSLLSDLGQALADQQDAAAAAQQALDLASSQYRHGAVSYLDVVQAQTAALDAQRSVLDLQTRQLRANVALVRALGGGWSTRQISPTRG